MVIVTNPRVKELIEKRHSLLQQAEDLEKEIRLLSYTKGAMSLRNDKKL